LDAVRELVANALVHRDLDRWSEGMAVEAASPDCGHPVLQQCSHSATLAV
jgi:hypothetical protein